MAEELTSKEELLAAIRDERAALEEAVEAVEAAPGEGMMLEPVFDGGWSVKDTLAHITVWEQLMIGWVEQSLRGEEPQRPITGDDWVDRLNARLYEENRDKPLDEVRQEFASSYREALALIQRVEEDDLFDPERFPWRDGSPLWQMVAANTNWHYKDHREAIADIAAV